MASILMSLGDNCGTTDRSSPLVFLHCHFNPLDMVSPDGPEEEFGDPIRKKVVERFKAAG
jgi:hypothetical protein